MHHHSPPGPARRVHPPVDSRAAGAWLLAWLALAAVLLTGAPRASGAAAEVKDLTLSGGLQDGRARLVIEAALSGLPGGGEAALVATTLEQAVTVGAERVRHLVQARVERLRGEPAELTFALGGEGEIRSVTGEGVQDWAVRRGTNGLRVLVVRPRPGAKPPAELRFTLQAEQEVPSLTNVLRLLTLASDPLALSSGFLRIQAEAGMDVQVVESAGLVPVEVNFLPEGLRGGGAAGVPEPTGFRFQGALPGLTVKLGAADPEATRVVWRDFRLEGRPGAEAASFTLTATAQARDPRGGVLAILSGGAALVEAELPPEVRLRHRDGRFELVVPRAGSFPVRLGFDAAVRPVEGWNRVDFQVAPAVPAPVILRGLAASTRFEFAGAARPEWSDGEFRSFLPPDGTVKLAWREAAPESAGRLFYAAEIRSQVTVSPGLMRQVALVEGRVMQGELGQVTLRVRGAGDVTAVQGPDLLAWRVEPGAGAADRRLVVQFNRPQKESFTLQVNLQSELGVFPQVVDAMQLEPEGATRLAGHVRVVNEGAVRLEVVQAGGLSQISPEQFPETPATKALFGAPAGQRFAFRFSSAGHALRIHADDVLPEVGVSELLTYHLGENETAVEAEFELDIREAPLREVLLRIPRGHTLARLEAAGMNDHFLGDGAGGTEAELRVVYGQPVTGRQVIRLRLERNGTPGETNWVLPRLEVKRARSTRGHVAVTAEAGLRLTPGRTEALTEIATAFLPRRLAGLQAAFRVTDPAWSAVLRVERLPQSIQTDAFHLFSIGEGIAYGSSTLNFFISGAPVSTFLIELSGEYFNVEFTGRDLRSNWQRTTNGYRVTLNTPVSGAYTLLATYERPFRRQGETLTFTGARPVEAEAEQGHTLVVSAYQFQVTPANVSAGLTELETAEVPPEYRLFFDAPILKAYRYAARPFNLQLTLSPLAQAETASLVVDRAALSTRISKDGEVITDAQYLVKNRGNPHLRLALPAGTTLWSATVNGSTVVPVQDGGANRIPLPQQADPNAVQRLELKLASRSPTPSRVTAAAPIVSAPVMLAEWRLEPDAGQRLTYRRGSLLPAGGPVDASGFAGLARMLRRDDAPGLRLILALALTGLAVGVWRWASAEDAPPRGVRQVGGSLVGLLAAVLATGLWGQWCGQVARPLELPPGLVFLAPVQQPDSALTVEVGNLAGSAGLGEWVAPAWPAALALVAGGMALFREPGAGRGLLAALAWTLLAWAAWRSPNGALAGLLVFLGFLLVQVILPAARSLLAGWRRPAVTAPAAPALLAGLLLLWPGGPGGSHGLAQTLPPTAPGAAIADSVVQEIRVEDGFAFATARLRWTATRDQILPVLSGPAVLTGIVFPTNLLKLVQGDAAGGPGHRVIALQSGPVELELRYQLQVGKRDNAPGIVLGTYPGLVNRVKLTLPGVEVDVRSTDAVSVRREAAATGGTAADLVLGPVPAPWISWLPRRRDLGRETAVFHAEWTQLHVPAAGVIEGLHQVQIRPAQGELGELVFDVPAGSTITEVAGVLAEGVDGAGDAAGLVSRWRFDPDARKLRVLLNPRQSRPFTLQVHSQRATGPLPFEQGAGLLGVEGAAGQVGWVGVATGSEVQLDEVVAEGFPPVNLEDFPAAVLEPLRGRIAGLALRRAFRQPAGTASLRLKVAAVEPDVRVETQQTLSLGEDRALLAVKAAVTVARAGIFRLSFVLPPGFEVESASGGALSHWTELKAAEGRIVTLHLKGRTEGEHPFNLTLAGTGTRSLTNLVLPRLAFREAAKQRGQLVLVPEQGLRLQVGAREGVAQVDPEKAGLRQPGVLAFRLLQSDWSLALGLEQVDAWVHVTGLQHVTVSEAQLKVQANLQYQIENTGLKAFRVRVPTNASGVRFRGEQVADFLPVAGSETNGLQLWEVKLHRRVIDRQLLQVSWQTPLERGAPRVEVQGVVAADAGLQRGFVTVQSSGRLQVRAEPPPAALQPAEWQGIPRALLQDLPDLAANYTYRLVEAGFRLPLALESHEAARLLPARVSSVTLSSVISDEGEMLTHVSLELIPGDKRLLGVALPGEASFWFAFVNRNGVWPWREADRILLPLEQQSRVDQATTVELFYSSRVGKPGRRKLDLSLLGPRFDLPLENITWRVHLNDTWKLADWSGSLQLQEEGTAGPVVVAGMKAYLDNEAVQNRQKTRVAEEMLSLGNSLLQQGDPQQARRAFQNAFGLSTHDSAFNEDARVQLHNLKLQQAMVGLNVRQQAVAGESAAGPAGAGSRRDLRRRGGVAYTQQEAKQLQDSNTADDNATLMRLAERLVQQQDAALPAPVAIRATVPEQGRRLTFRRTVQVGTFADLDLRLKATAAQTAPGSFRWLALGGVFVLVLGFSALAGGNRPRKAATSR